MIVPITNFHPSIAAGGGPINILLVGDQPAKLLGYQTILQELGENLLMAHSAREALELLLQNDVALLLVSVGMSELDGFELVELIRAYPRFEKTAVMFVSGVHLSIIDRIRGYSAGVIDYVRMPVVPELLRAKLRVFADLHRKMRQLEHLNRDLEGRIAQRTADLEASTQEVDEMRWSPELFALLGRLGDGPAPTRAEFLAHVDIEDRDRVGALFQSLPMPTVGGTSLGSFELEFRFNRPGYRTPMWLRTTGGVVVDADGRPIIARGIHQDVTTRKNAELQLEVEGRRKGELLAMLAHELRGPLAPIVSCVHLLKSGALEPEAVARNHVILERQVLHLVRLVDNFIDMSRISRGIITLAPVPTDLAALVRVTIDATRLSASNHVIVSELPEQGPFAFVDPVRMAQVVSNILDNATKFTPAGGKIIVGLVQDKGDAVLRIVDTGIGIAPQDIDRVFDLFTQVERGLGGRGLGIGLTLVRRVLELQGGTVTANSRGEGLGTEIVVRLPCLAERRVEVPRVEPSTTTSTPRHARCSVQVVCQ